MIVRISLPASALAVLATSSSRTWIALFSCLLFLLFEHLFVFSSLNYELHWQEGASPSKVDAEGWEDPWVSFSDICRVNSVLMWGQISTRYHGNSIGRWGPHYLGLQICPPNPSQALCNTYLKASTWKNLTFQTLDCGDQNSLFSWVSFSGRCLFLVYKTTYLQVTQQLSCH